MIEILIFTISFLVILLMEFFLLSLFTFSIFVILSLFLLKKINWKIWLLSTSTFSIFLDIVLQYSIGTHLFVISLCWIFVMLLFLLIPERRVIFSFLPYFLGIVLFYILIYLLSSVFSDGIWPQITLNFLLRVLIKSSLSIAIFITLESLLGKFRGSKGGLSI